MIIINIIAFVVFGLDKLYAIKHKWRVPEATLFALAIAGGSVGALAAMHIFHHKTRKMYFAIGIPSIVFVQVILGILLYTKI